MPDSDTTQVSVDVGAMLASLGPAGVLVLAVLALVLLGKSEAARRAVKRSVRALYRRLSVVLWARHLGIPYGLARRLHRAQWGGIVESRGLSGLARGKVAKTPYGVRVALHLNGRLNQPVVAAQTVQIAAALGLSARAVSIKSAGREDRATLEIMVRDPLADAILWTPPNGVVRLADKMKLSVSRSGTPIALDVKNRIGIFGTSGSGKSCVQRLIGAHVAQAVDADMEVWDLKYGLESQHFEGKAHRITSVEDAVARTEWLLEDEFEHRADIMRSKGTSSWKETPESPARVIMVDEGNVIIREFSDMERKRFFRAVEQGRALGVYFVWATQFPKHTNLPTELRSQLNITICMSLTSVKESRVIFDDEQWQPHKLPGKGWLLMQSDAQRYPVESRAVWLDEDVFKGIAPKGQPVSKTRTAPVFKETPAVPMGTAVGDSLMKYAIPEGQPLVPPVSPTRGQPKTVGDTAAELSLSALLLSDRPLGVREIARGIGKDPATVSRALAKLAESGSVVKSDDGKFTIPTLPVNDRSAQPEHTEE